MSSGDRRDQEHRLAAMAAAYDEALASGTPPPELDPTIDGLDAESTAELGGICECLELLDSARRLPQLDAPCPREEGRAWTAALGGSDTAAPHRTLGRFELVRELGRGGYGIVFLAFDPRLGRNVALKLPRPEVLVDTRSRLRFLREAAAAATLDHPNIVAVHEVGEAGPVCYIAGAYCEGPTLAEWLAKQRTTPSPHTAAKLVAILADALQHAHSRGILHRDLKPANVLLQPRAADGAPDAEGLEFIPRLTDFGLAKLVECETASTQSGAVLGTVQYMAPEQAEGRLKDIGTHTDVFALGVILYELLTGRPPFRGETDADTLRRLLTVDPIRPSTQRRGLARDLEAVCLRCLEKEPDRRYRTAAALADDLRRFLAGEPTVARPVGALGRTARWARRRPAAAGLVGVCLGAAIALFVGTWWHLVSLKGALDATQRARADADSQMRVAEDSERHIRQFLYAADMKLALVAWQNADIGHMVQLLNRHHPETEQENIRGFEWHYLWRLCHSDRLTLRGHTGEVYYVSFSPDGKTLATASQDHSVKLWDAATGQEIRTLVGHSGEVTCAVFSPDGTLLATSGEDRTAKLWDVASGTERATLTGHADTVYATAFTPDGKTLVTAGRDAVIKLWDVASGRPTTTLQGHTKSVESLAISPDGQTLASVSGDQTARLWDLASGRERAVLRGHVNTVLSAAFSSDSKTLATCGDDQRVILWDVATAQQEASLRGHGDTIQCVTFSPDGRTIASAGKDSTVRLWDAATGQPQGTIKGHIGRIWSIAYSPDGQTLTSAGADQTVRLWDVGMSAERVVGVLQKVASVAFAPDSGTLIVFSLGGTEVRDVATGRLKAAYPWHTLTIRRGIAVSPDRQTVAWAGEDTVEFWNLATGRREKLETDSRAVARGSSLAMATALGFAPDGRSLAVASRDLTVRLCSLETGRVGAPLEGHASDVMSVAFSPDGRLLATASNDATVRVWDTATGQERAILRGHAQGVFAVAFDESGRLVATASGDGTIKLWDVATWQERATLRAHRGAVATVAFSPDGRTLASGSEDGTVRLWSMATDQELFELDGPTGPVHSVTFSPDGTTLASGGETSDGTGEVFLWSAATDAESFSDGRLTAGDSAR